MKAARRSSREAAQPQYSKIINATVKQQPSSKPPPATRVEQKVPAKKISNLPPTKPSPTTYPPTLASSSSIKKKDSYNLATKNAGIAAQRDQIGLAKGVSKQASIKGKKITNIDVSSHAAPSKSPTSPEPLTTDQPNLTPTRIVKLAPPPADYKISKEVAAVVDAAVQQQTDEPVVVMVRTYQAFYLIHIVTAAKITG